MTFEYIHLTEEDQIKYDIPDKFNHGKPFDRVTGVIDRERNNALMVEGIRVGGGRHIIFHDLFWNNYHIPFAIERERTRNENGKTIFIVKVSRLGIPENLMENLSEITQMLREAFLHIHTA